VPLCVDETLEDVHEAVFAHQTMMRRCLADVQTAMINSVQCRPPSLLRSYGVTDFAGALARWFTKTKLARSASEVWRRRESNPRPRVRLRRNLHA